MHGSIGVLRAAVHAAGGWAWLLMVASVLDGLTRLVLPAAIGLAVDAVLGTASAHLAVGAVVVLVVLSTVTEMTREIAQVRAKARGAVRLRNAVVDHVFRLGLGVRARFGTGDVISRTLQSTTEAADAAPAAVVLVSSALTSVGGIVALFLIDVPLGLVFVLSAPAVWWLMRWLVGRMAHFTEHYQRLYSMLSNRFVDAMAGVRTIRASATCDHEVDRVLAPLPRLREAGEQFWAMQAKAGWQLGLVVPLMQVSVLGLAGVGVVHGRVTPGEMLAATGYVGHAMGLLRQATTLARLARARGAAERVAGLFAQSLRPEGRSALPEGDGTLVLRDVHVDRAGTTVLCGLDLTVSAGHTVAVVGRTESGKTTLVEVVGGLLAPDEGQVLLDGARMEDIDPAALRSAVAYAFERPNLLGETISDAVAYADRPVGEDRVRDALAASGALGFVSRLPKGVHTPATALQLSGGELQRLGLASAIARNPRLLLLDDATSSVDTATEAEITRAMRTVARDVTTVVVAHRMSTAAQADLVAWLENGRVRTLAPHHELMADPNYRDLFATAPVVRT